MPKDKLTSGNMWCKWVENPSPYFKILMYGSSAFVLVTGIYNVRTLTQMAFLVTVPNVERITKKAVFVCLPTFCLLAYPLTELEICW